MVAAPAIPLSGESRGEQRTGRAESVRAGDSGHDSNRRDASELAFDGILAAVGTSLTVRADVRTDASASQMFEAPSTDARAQRRATMKREYALDNSARDLAAGRDRASVQARRAAEHRADARQGADHPLKVGDAVGGGPKAAASVSESAWTAARAVDGLPKALESADGSRADRAASLGTKPTDHAAPPRPTDGSVATAPFSGISSEGARIVAKNATTVAPVERPNSLSAAQNVARALARSPGGDVDAGRASGAVSGGTEAGDAGRGKQPGSRPSNAAQQQVSTGAQAKADNVEKPDGAQRTAFEELVRSLQLRGGARRSSARLQLEPPELGRVQVNVRLDGANVNIDVRTESSHARDLVQERAAQLKIALEQHGIHVDRLEVSAVSKDGPVSEPGSEFGAGFGAAGDDSEGKPTGDRVSGDGALAPGETEESNDFMQSDAVNPSPHGAASMHRRIRSTSHRPRIDIRI